MFKFILKRILMVIPTFIAITFVTFALIHFIPGDPVEIMMGEARFNTRSSSTNDEATWYGFTVVSTIFQFILVM